MAERQIAVRDRLRAAGGTAWQDEASRARALAQLALALEQQGDYDGGALAVEIWRTPRLRPPCTRRAPNQMLERGLAEIRSRKVPVLLALGRTADAAREGAGRHRSAAAAGGVGSAEHPVPARIWPTRGSGSGDARHAEGRLDEALGCIGARLRSAASEPRVMPASSSCPGS